ncbi:immunity protein Imm33 domain-containing protein [Cupriavidus basilensis]|uniref:immunity protein Imm33 domain-containing protein n=1 Tax=Cupriavidus basilensis TaxID=68895 RepID=UPI0020A632B6|nr:hypothetical protein [Cupriavidus basilensis]MCP3022873.1 hypothetical protein [Cupriavidus basilensis]
MNEYRSNLRERYSHPDIVVGVAPEFGSGFEWLLSYFDGEVAAGTVFHENQLVQIGWMMVMLRADHHGDLEVWEPRFDSVPISWVRGATTTLRHLMLQRETCAQLGTDPAFPSLRQSGVVSSDFFTSEEFCMERETSNERTDSGWLFKAQEQRSHDGRHRSLFELAVARSAVIPFLALPAGTIVVHGRKRVEISLGDHRISSNSNAFLARLLERGNQ